MTMSARLRSQHLTVIVVADGMTITQFFTAYRYQLWPSSAVNEVGRSMSSTTCNGHTRWTESMVRRNTSEHGKIQFFFGGEGEDYEKNISIWWEPKPFYNTLQQWFRGRLYSYKTVSCFEATTSVTDQRSQNVFEGVDQTPFRFLPFRPAFPRGLIRRPLKTEG